MEHKQNGMDSEHCLFFEAEGRIRCGVPYKYWLLRDAVQRCKFISKEFQEH